VKLVGFRTFEEQEMFKELIAGSLVAGVVTEPVLPPLQAYLAIYNKIVVVSGQRVGEADEIPPPNDKQLPEEEGSPHNEQNPIQEWEYVFDRVNPSNTTTQPPGGGGYFRVTNGRSTNVFYPK
jgi:hypothetical protein